MPAAMAANYFFDRACELERFRKRDIFSHLHNQAGDATSGRFFAEIAEYTSEIFFAIAVYDVRRGDCRSWIHSHVERTVPHHAKPAGCVLQLAGRNAEIEKSAADFLDAEFVENFIGVAKICLAKRDAAAEMHQLFARLFDRVRILVERENVSAHFQNGFSVAAAADCSIDNERARMRC